MFSGEDQRHKLSLEEKLESIRNCCGNFSGDKAINFNDKGCDYFMTEEFHAVESQIMEAVSFKREVNFFKGALERKLKSSKSKESVSTEEREKLELISTYQEDMDKISSINKELDRFKSKANTEILIKRTYVPQEYAGISAYQAEQNQYLVATASMMPCVGVAFYCKDLQQGIVIHFDHEHNNVEHIKNYFHKLFSLIQGSTKEVIITIVLSNYDHKSLDSNVQKAIDEFKDYLQETGVVVSMVEKKTPTTIACLVLNLANGTVCTNYHEGELQVNRPLGEALNIPKDGAELYHLRGGDIYLQPKDELYQKVTDEEKDTPFSIPINCMIPQDSVAKLAIRSHAAGIQYPHHTSSTSSSYGGSSAIALSVLGDQPNVTSQGGEVLGQPHPHTSSTSSSYVDSSAMTSPVLSGVHSQSATPQEQLPTQLSQEKPLLTVESKEHNTKGKSTPGKIEFR